MGHVLLGIIFDKKSLIIEAHIKTPYQYCFLHRDMGMIKGSLKSIYISTQSEFTDIPYVYSRSRIDLIKIQISQYTIYIKEMKRLKGKYKIMISVFVILLLLMTITAVLVRRSFYVEPEFPSKRVGEPQPRRPTPDDPVFYREQFESNFTLRKQTYLDWVSNQSTPNGSRDAIWTELAKIQNGQDHFPHTTLKNLTDFVQARNDCADFTMAGLIRLYYSSMEVLTSPQRDLVKETILGFQYWLDEPNPNRSAMELWTENHQILIFSSEYLAGQLFPKEIFTNNGMSGIERMEHSYPMILRWMEWRFKTGFAEWDSNTYYPEDIAALLNLVDFSEILSARASTILDLIMFDIAVDSFYGLYGCSHGRSMAKNVQSSASDPIVTIEALMWGLGRFHSKTSMGVISLALSNYSLPSVIEEIALHMPDVMVNKERHSIPITESEANKRNLSFSSSDDMVIWWGMGGLSHPLAIEGTLNRADDWGLWHYPDFRDMKDIGKLLQALDLLEEASRALKPDSNGAILSEVNKITYRTPDYMLSNAQDWRKGVKGYQQHIWQATLGPYAVVFVTNPDSMKDSDRPGYWISNGRLPRTAQYDNTLIAVHKIDRSIDLMESGHYAFTHAYFPTWAFDEVREIQSDVGGGWIFGRKGDGYVGLYCDHPYEWQTEGIEADQEIVSLCRENIWICHMGRKAVDGEFDDFVEKVSGSKIVVDGLDIEYHAEGIGKIEFGWTGPLMVNNKEVSLRDYPRWENPYSRTFFDSDKVLIEFNDRILELKWDVD